MILDYTESTGYFTVKVPRSDNQLIKTLMKDHGLDFAPANSTTDTACLATRSQYAAMTYSDHATPAARAKFGMYLPELEASRALSMSRKCKTPPGLDLYPFQQAGVDYTTRRTHSLIGDSPGLGKTPMAIVTANEIEAKRVLVVCPASIRKQWADRIREWSTMEGRYVIYPIYGSKDGVHPAAAWTVVSYDLLRSPVIHACLREGRYDLIILDECHYLKTPSAARTKALFDVDNGLSNSAGAILGLTGTPLPNRPRECYTLSRNLCWGAIDYMSERSFQDRFNPVELRKGKNGGKYQIEKTGRLLELQNRLRANFMVRRQKRDVLEQLPDIQHEIVHVEETGGIRRALKEEKLLNIDPENLSGIDAKILGHISTVRMMMGVAKAPLVADYVNTLMEGGEEKLVVFTWHREVLDILERSLSKWKPVRIDGSVPSNRRSTLIERFIHERDCGVFLGNLQSIGEGVDGLQKVCNRAVFAECSWTPSHNDQGIGRLERIGAVGHGILIEFLVAEGSLDERVLGSSLRKLKDINAALDARM